MLFSDIEGSTRLLSQLGERYAEALSVQRSIMRSEFARWRGHEMGTEGDSFFVVFPSATDAAEAALAAQRRIQHHPWPNETPLRVRMGLHTGEPARHEDGYLGMDVHRAARIAATANGGQIVVSAATASLVTGKLAGTELTDVGWHRLKDIPDPEHIFQLSADGLPQHFPPLKSLGTRTNLPLATGRIVGRDGELAELTELFSRPDVRLVTLTGPGGSGKTRLAIAAAELRNSRFAEDVYFVPLSAATSAEVMWSTLGEVLGVPGEGRAPPTFFEHIAHRSMLVILDNLEQLSDAPIVVSEILAHASEVTILATSRRPLHVAGEYEHEVPPLELPTDAALDAATAESSGAVALFVQRAQMVRPGFRLTDDNVADVVDICQRLDGMPLAIELAAARAKLMSPRAVLARLDRSLELTGSELERPTRQRTLRNTIAWSYDLLTPEQQGFFRQLGVFAGGSDLDAVSAVVRSGGDPLDAVGELVDVSLVTIRDGTDGEPRAGLLQTVRAFALEQLDAAGEAAATSRRHAEHYLALAEELAPQLRSAQYLPVRDRIELELDNLRAALQWCLRVEQHPAHVGDDDDVTTGLRLCQALSWFWYACGYAGEGRRWLEQAVDRAADQETPELVSVLHGLGVLLLQQGEPEQGKIVLTRCLDFWRRRGDASKTAKELNSVSIAHRYLGEIDEGRQLLEEGIGLARGTADNRQLANLLSTLGVLETDAGASQRAIELLAQAVEVDHELGDAWGEAVDRVNLAAARLRAGEPERAHSDLQDVADEVLSLNDVDLTINLIEMLAAALAEMGDAPRAARLFGTAETMREQADLPRPAPDATVLEHTMAKVRITVDESTWDGHVEDGRSLSAEAAIAEGLQPTD
jgi:predicted ATPase/class 3 adenylate cyclase